MSVVTRKLEVKMNVQYATTSGILMAAKIPDSDRTHGLEMFAIYKFEQDGPKMKVSIVTNSLSQEILMTKFIKMVRA